MPVTASHKSNDHVKAHSLPGCQLQPPQDSPWRQIPQFVMDGKSVELTGKAQNVQMGRIKYFRRQFGPKGNISIPGSGRRGIALDTADDNAAGQNQNAQHTGGSTIAQGHKGLQSARRCHNYNHQEQTKIIPKPIILCSQGHPILNGFQHVPQ
jgi:hypothetical protein